MSLNNSYIDALFRYIILFWLFVIYSFHSYSQSKKEITAVRITEKITIDGKLDESIWKDIPIASEFIQLDPDNGKPSNYKSEVKFIYDNKALYIGAILYDPEPDKINDNLSKRDDLENNDFFLVLLDPFNNGLDGFEFIVTPANIQLDAKVSNIEDFSWDAVWKSATKTVDNGWVVEMEIPYSAIRFPDKPIQEWGLNIIRNIQRDREKVTWNFIDKKITGFVNQSGVLSGIKDLKPPLRLSFVPFTSVYYIKNTDGTSEEDFKGGIDLKWGINESYTLDMMLVPDFGQVESDDEVLNLSPFEIQFEEKRQFFTEANEIFTRGEIFYSRRIGDRPYNYYDVEDELNENEIIDENPLKSKIINATKISGRNSKGIGIGFLNAMSKKTYAKITDTITNSTREFVTQPFTNYNLLFFDKSLKNESYVSFFNSNAYIPDDDAMENVTGTDIYLKNKKKTYGYQAQVMISQQYNIDDDDKIGFKSEFDFKKLKGKYRYGIETQVISDKYEQNKLGFLRRNNYFENEIWLQYIMPQANEKYVVKNFYFDISQRYQFNPARFSELNFVADLYFRRKSQIGFSFWTLLFPTHQVDFYEPRVDGKKLKKPSRMILGSHFHTDFRKKLHSDFGVEYSKLFSGDDRHIFFFIVEPTFRFNDKLSLKTAFRFIYYLNEFGYVDDETLNDEEVVYIGRRNRLEINNILSLNYIFNSKTYFSIRARHYASNVGYKQFYKLKDDGFLNDSDYDENSDINYNSFNIDALFNWRFAQGSEISLVWKNSIQGDNELSEYSYSRNFKNIFKENKYNSISIRLIYYLDYLNLRKRKKNKS